MIVIKKLKNANICSKFSSQENLEAAKNFCIKNPLILVIKEAPGERKMYLEIVDDEKGSVNEIMQTICKFSPEYLSRS